MKCAQCPREATVTVPEIVQNFGLLGGWLLNRWVALCDVCVTVL